MTSLNLPDFEYKLKKTEGKVFIFDVIRKRYVLLTPEEWVRQHFLHFLISHLKYPRSLIKVERGLQYNKLLKRFDIVVYDSFGAPWMVVECKSHDQKIKQQVLQQVSVYNKTIKAKYVTVTNGLDHFCFSVDHQTKSISLVNQFPPFLESG